MALGTALVDRARMLENLPDARRVEGTTQMEEIPGEWFRCRLLLEGSPEGDDSEGGRVRTVRRPQLLVGARDEAGDPVELRSSDAVEVRSDQLGDGRWRLTGDPQPLRKRRRVIGWLADLAQVQENERE